MADRSHHDSAVYGLALIALGAAVHYGWALVPAQYAADAWNILGAAARAALLLALVWRARWPVVLAAAWWLAEEALVIGCSGAYIFWPWPSVEGQAQCSSLLHFDLGKIGAVALVGIALYLYKYAGYKA
jgi:hypothetical protein